MLITTNKQLQKVAEILKSQKQIAVDTEFYWMRTYYPQLCLIQVATESETYLIDTLEDIDFSPLKGVFEDSSIEKIIHSAANDIPIIRKFLSCDVNNIFDTQVAATFLGYQVQLSLKALIKDIIGIEMEKESQFSDWRKRPLSDKQINYAITDVKYLIELKENLEQRLDKTDYKVFFEEETLEIQSTEFNSIDNIHNKIGNIQKFNESTQTKIILIAQWREKIAQEKDIPVRFIFDNKVLYTLGHQKLSSTESFTHPELKKLKPWIKKGIISTIKSSKNIESLIVEKKVGQKISPEVTNDIISFFESQTSKLNFENSVIASRKDIRSLIYNLNINNTKLPNNKLLHGWRYKLIGKRLQEYILNK